MPLAQGGTYWVARLGGQEVAGIFPLSEPDFNGIADHWFTYFSVDDVDAMCDRFVEAGGSVVRPAFDVPNVGRTAVVSDASGATMAIITAVEG